MGVDEDLDAEDSYGDDDDENEDDEDDLSMHDNYD